MTTAGDDYISVDREWIATTYLSHLGTLLDSNLTYLHSTLTWAITILLGGLGFVVTRSSFPDRFSVTFLCVLTIVLGHFAVRTAKAYLNVARFASLEKDVLHFATSAADEAPRELRQAIKLLHCKWVSPLKLRWVLYKLLFELGFVYFFGIVLALVWYSLCRIGLDMSLFVSLVITFLLLALEVWLGLVRSAYFISVVSKEIALERR